MLKSQQIKVHGSLGKHIEITILNKNHSDMTILKVRWILKVTNYAKEKKVSDAFTKSTGFASHRETKQT